MLQRNLSIVPVYLSILAIANNKTTSQKRTTSSTTNGRMCRQRGEKLYQCVCLGWGRDQGREDEWALRLNNFPSCFNFKSFGAGRFFRIFSQNYTDSRFSVRTSCQEVDIWTQVTRDRA